MKKIGLKSSPAIRDWVNRGFVLAMLLVATACTVTNPPALTPAASTAAKVAATQSLQPGLTEPTTTSIEPASSFSTVAPSVVYQPGAPVWGIELHWIDQPIAELVKQAGNYWIRRNALMWADIEPTEGARNWQAAAKLDQELEIASAQGSQVILVVRSTPAWAQLMQGNNCGPILPEKIAAFAAFMKDAVQRYSVPPYNVRYWEIWNEPDVPRDTMFPESPFGCWGDPTDPYYGGGYYADVLKAAYPQIKAANPDVQVLVGGLLMDCDPVTPPESPAGSGQFKDCTPSRYIEGILENGGGDYFDGISFHAYDSYKGELGAYYNPNWHAASDLNGPSLIQKARYLRSILARYGFPEKYLVNTELALLCGRDGTEEPCINDTYLRTKANYLAQAYASAIAERLSGNIWYSLTGWRATGLVDSTLQPNLAYDAFATSAAQLSGMGYAGEISQFPGVKGYAFEKDGKQVWILWSLDGADHPIQLDSIPSGVTDVYGEPKDASQDLIITLEPVYITWSP